MPVVESVTPGVSPGPLPFLATASSRKEKKKQAKEERDRLKQAEKKKRRLEKALATAAAIRTELEKKKQRRKEEEQRLDEEGAALAEAVALQVLVDEEPDGLGPLQVEREENSQRDGDEGASCSEERIVEDTNMAPVWVFVRREPVQHNGLKRHGSFKYSACADNDSERETKEWKRSELEPSEDRVLVSVRDDMGVEGELVEAGDEVTWEVCSSAEEKARASNERAQRAEVAAGLAAAQAVAALRIAEEARAEAEAAKKAAEEAMNEALDQCDTYEKPESLDKSKATSVCVEKERDELKARLQETERKLREKTRRVSELEHNLEEVTQYLLDFKAMIEGSKHGSLTLCDHSREDTGASSEQGDATPAESSGGTVGRMIFYQLPT